jgi:Fe2+ or Zn2+ uptake regulation protein
MDVNKIIGALNSGLRREILSILSKQPMTVLQVLEELKKRIGGVRYRETVYRALERLVDSGLVEKYYEKEKGLCYKLVSNCITIRINKDSIDISR